MNIKSVETKYITESPFAGLCEPEIAAEMQAELEPYYTCKIVTDNGTFRGKGETKEAAHKDAVENMQAAAKNEVAKSVSKYNAEQGVYFVDC